MTRTALKCGGGATGWLHMLLGVVLSLLATFPAPARADARRDYVDALRALREERWAEALPLLERAARDRPQEEARVRLVGAIPEPYLPWHYLGLTYSRLGRCAEALRAWSTSDSQATIQRLPERMAERQAPRERCITSEAASEATVAAVLEPVTPRALEAIDPTPATAVDPPPAPTPAAPPSEAPAPTLDPALGRAADEFAAGDLDAALDALAGMTATDERHLALGAFLEAAICHARYELGGRQDAGEGRRARDAALRVKRLRPDLEPDPTLFSRRFVEWYRGVRPGN